jgi:hypothetical protein
MENSVMLVSRMRGTPLANLSVPFAHSKIAISPLTYLTMGPLDLVPANSLDREEHAKKDEEVIEILSVLFDSKSKDLYWVFVVVAERVRWPTMTDDTDFLRQAYLEHRVALDAIAAEALETRSFERIRRLGARRFFGWCAWLEGNTTVQRFYNVLRFVGNRCPHRRGWILRVSKVSPPRNYKLHASNAALTDRSAIHSVWVTATVALSAPYRYRESLEEGVSGRRSQAPVSSA